jgi:hypothetical protein
LQWVRDGGTLVTTAGAGLFDRYHQPMSTLSEAAGITPAAPVRMPIFRLNDVKANGTVERAGAKATVFGDRENIANVPPAPGTQIVATFDDGMPAITERVLGKGRIIRFAFYPGISYRKSVTGDTNGLPSGFSEAWRNLIVQPVRTAITGVNMPVTVKQAMIEAPALYSKTGVAVTLLNWSGTPQDVEVTVTTDKKVRSVESAEKGKLPFKTSKLGTTIRVPLGDVDVLSLRY